MSTLCTQTRARLKYRVLSLRLIEQFALLMVILFISLELSLWVCLHQRLAVRAAVFGQGITLMDGELGGEKEVRLETGLLHSTAGWAWGKGTRPLPGSTSDLRREGNVSVRDRKRGWWWKLEMAAPRGSHPSSRKADTKF